MASCSYDGGLANRHGIKIASKFVETHDEAEANAERLTLCWNCHDDLLAACKLALGVISLQYFKGDKTCKWAIPKINAAIASATTDQHPAGSAVAGEAK